MNMFELTEEQTNIINRLLSGKNVVCEAVAGAGKTTTVLGLANKTDKKIIQLTYNRILKDEVKDKAKDYNNLSIYTYHGFATYIYGIGRDDNDLRIIIETNKEIKRKIIPDIIVLDESQDMKILFFKFLCKYFSDIGFLPRILILGDCRQSIYKFMGSDSRFISHINALFSFDKMQLMQSWRVSKEIAWFVNNIMLNKQIIKVTRESPPNPVLFLSGDIFGNILVNDKYEDYIGYLTKIIKYEMTNNKIKPDDIFVLTSNMKINVNNKNRPPWKRLLMNLVNEGLPCYLSNSEEKIGSDSIKNKIAFSTIHAAKGRERKVVILIGFDSGFYYSYKNPQVNICPNELYVAATRAIDKLILVEHLSSKNSRLPFLNNEFLQNNDFLQNNKYMKYIGHNKINNSNQIRSKDQTEKLLIPTKIIKFIDSTDMVNLTNLCDQIYQKESDKINIINTTNEISCEFEWTQNDTKKKCILRENVSAINGVLIPQLWHYKINNSEIFSLYLSTRIKISNLDFNDKSESKFYTKLIEEKYGDIKRHPETLSDFLFITNLYISLMDSTTHLLSQIDKYDWLSYKEINECFNYMNLYIDANCSPEIPLKVDINNIKLIRFYNKVLGETVKKVIVSAVVDFVDYENNIIWEIKCKNEINLEDKLQLVIYAWICNINKISAEFDESTESNESTESDKYDEFDFKILNIRSGEIFKLVKNFKIINEIMKILIINNEKQMQFDNDDLFISNCKKIINQYGINELINDDYISEFDNNEIDDYENENSDDEIKFID